LLETAASRAALALDRAFTYQEVVRLTELQRDFIALAAHELRTPATTIYGLAATLRARATELEPTVVDELRETLYTQADRLHRLVDQLLDLSRIDADTVKITRQTFLLRDHLEEIVTSVAAGRADDVQVDAPDELEVNLDPAAIDRVVGNLVVNALRYGAPPVKVSAQQTDRHVRIRVEDSGRGVASDFVPYLFERFRRSTKFVGDSTGTGLGLAIARSYARAHGGDLFYAARKPHGSCFELVLPARPNV
jgi:signal transduction histidine kinase